MKKLLLTASLGLMLTGSSVLLRATPITLPEVTNSYLFVSPVYNVIVITGETEIKKGAISGGQLIESGSGFVRPVGQGTPPNVTSDVTTTVVLAFTPPHPGTLIEALLNLSYSLPSDRIADFSRTSPASINFTPAFDITGTPTGYFVVSYGGTSITLPAGTTTYDLLPQFRGALESGAGVTVTWHGTDPLDIRITNLHATIPPCDECTDHWSGRGRVSGTVSGTLTVDYGEELPSAVPEPAAAMLIGGGLLTLGLVRRFW
jgi:hypothetical protein